MKMKGGVGLLQATEVCCEQPASSLLCRLGLWTQGQSIIVVFTSWPDLPLQPATEELSLDTVLFVLMTHSGTPYATFGTLCPIPLFGCPFALALQDMSILLPR